MSAHKTTHLPPLPHVALRHPHDTGAAHATAQPQGQRNEGGHRLGQFGNAVFRHGRPAQRMPPQSQRRPSPRSKNAGPSPDANLPEADDRPGGSGESQAGGDAPTSVSSRGGKQDRDERGDENGQARERRATRNAGAKSRNRQGAAAEGGPDAGAAAALRTGPGHTPRLATLASFVTLALAAVDARRHGGASGAAPGMRGQLLREVAALMLARGTVDLGKNGLGDVRERLLNAVGPDPKPLAADAHAARSLYRILPLMLVHLQRRRVESELDAMLARLQVLAGHRD
ncbi:hypothetical protein [Caldimonas brevitalea]|uniref:Uncharacterized protein n=1 Tax=Caldimonas brevitalea TaxID=413882 RepID=A0A0G3BEU9_9BURK|nr:hypothetical protein [Caldimonas brevitalea]AKJ27812.1 hypothetical protein AAW51_1121 [Caldimonas brevitalea]